MRSKGIFPKGKTGIFFIAFFILFITGGFLLNVDNYGLAVIPSPEHITIEGDRLTLHGDMYGYTGNSEKPGKVFILLHSSNRLARNMPFNRIIARYFSDAGIVLNVDLRGFGDTAISYEVRTRNDLDFGRDVASWVDFAHERFDISYNDIVIIGRGTGAAATINYLREFPVIPVWAVLVVPPRGDKLARDLFVDDKPFMKRRWQKDMTGGPIIPVEVIRDLSSDMRLEALPSAQRERPVLFVDSATTMDTGLLMNVYKQMTGPKKIIITTQGDHYFGTGSIVNTVVGMVSDDFPYILYDKLIFSQVVVAIEEFINADDGGFANG